MKKLLATAAALAVSFGAINVLADDGQHGGDRKARMEKLDANGDGAISRAEAEKAPRLSKSFDAIDANKDGQISKDEMAAFRKAHHDKARAPAQKSGN